MTQIANIIKLLCHEVLRVFSDRMIDREDDLWLKSLLTKTVINNFCTSKESDSLYRPVSELVHTETPLNMQPSVGHSDSAFKGKKAVTFKTGLVSERSFRNFHEALISKEQV